MPRIPINVYMDPHLETGCNGAHYTIHQNNVSTFMVLIFSEWREVPKTSTGFRATR